MRKSIAICLVLTGCNSAPYDFSPYDASYSDTEMLYEPGYIIRDSGESLSSRPDMLDVKGRGSTEMPTLQHATEVQVAHPHGDSAWVHQQAPQAYTIELIDDAMPAVVASQLLQTPKTQHSAEYRYVKNGKIRYKGLYGSFQSQQEAQAALQTLPDGLKAKARIKQFVSIHAVARKSNL